MWKRFQGHGREKEKQIGNPVLVETTYDEDQLRHMANVSDAAQNANYQPYASGGASGYPPQTNNTLSAPRASRNHRASDAPTVSSIYSQPSPGLGYDYNPTAGPPSGLVDVSPPSSPEPERYHRNQDPPRRFRSMRDVSPVDESRGKRAPSGGASNIPVLRKVPSIIRDKESQSTQKFWGGKVAPNSKVRWDEYSGEPAPEGKAAQVNPANYVKGSLPPGAERRPMGYQVSVSSGPQEQTKKNANSFSERASRFGTKSPSPVDTTLPKPREPWKGASGRVEIVAPLKNQPTKEPFQYARKNAPDAGVKSASGGTKNKAGVSLSVPTTVKRVPVAADTTPVAEEDTEADMHEDPIKPVVPLKVGRNSPPRSLASPVSPNHPGITQQKNPYVYPSPITPTNAQHPANEYHGSKQGPLQPHSTPPNTKVVRKSIEGTPGSTSSKDNGLASRFSWTTYNTSTTYQQSPPPSPPPPIPTSAQELASSILNRRRPVQASDKLPTRKPITSSTARPRTMTSDPPSPRPLSTFSTNTQKALPRPPTEISAADHVDILEAQLDDLRLRRSNVNRLLQDLNAQAPSNPLVTDFRRMRIVERRKKDFEDELAEIRREEHDVGLRLHRAWKKREREDPNGTESAIWIRRVTR